MRLLPNPLYKLWGKGGGGDGGGGGGVCWLCTCGSVGRDKARYRPLTNLSPTTTLKPSLHLLAGLRITENRSSRVCEGPKILSHPDSQLWF